MDFSVRKNPEHKSSGRDFTLGVQSSENSGSLKNLKPEKIGLWAKFNRHISRPDTYILGSTIDLNKVAEHWAAMTTPSKQYKFLIYYFLIMFNKENF